jgi:hypothetical protein
MNIEGKLKLVLMDEAGNVVAPDPSKVGSRTTQQLLDLFADLVQLQMRKGQEYGEAWRSQGYMGNVARVLSKASRLKNMLWRDFQMESADEPIEETLGDLVNLAAFAVLNYRDRNKWGS